MSKPEHTQGEAMSESSNQQADLATLSYVRASHAARKIFNERHAKYGADNIAAFGLIGCVVRATDKTERLRRAVTLGGGFDDETVEDSLIDLANYALIGLACLRGEWPGTETDGKGDAL